MRRSVFLTERTKASLPCALSFRARFARRQGQACSGFEGSFLGQFSANTPSDLRLVLRRSVPVNRNQPARLAVAAPIGAKLRIPIANVL